jgi:hypothetical protein
MVGRGRPRHGRQAAGLLAGYMTAVLALLLALAGCAARGKSGADRPGASAPAGGSTAAGAATSTSAMHTAVSTPSAAKCVQGVPATNRTAPRIAR